MSQFEAQHLTMTAWSFANLQLLDAPLIAAIAAAARELLPSFAQMEIASLAWSVACSPIDEGDRAEILLSLSFAPAILEDGWHGHSLCILASAFFPVRALLRPEVAAFIEDRWQCELTNLERVLRGAVVAPGKSWNATRFAGVSSSYETDLMDTGLFHVGPYYSGIFLRQLGIAEAECEFVSEASKLLQDKDLAIQCILECSLLCSEDTSILIRRQFVSSAVFEGQGHFVPASLAHDRGGHAERLALEHALNEVLASCRPYGLCSPQATGRVQLLVNHHPCLSCIGVMLQFRCALPNVTLRVAFEWQPGARRSGHAAAAPLRMLPTQNQEPEAS